MGYRSDVRIVTSKKGYDELEKYIKKEIKNMPEQTYNLLEYCDFKTMGKTACSFGWNDIKWYDNTFGGYEDVLLIENGLKHLEDKDLSYRFARIGESYEDFEEQLNDGDNDINLPYPYFERGFDDEYVEQFLGEITERKGEYKVPYSILKNSLVNSLKFIKEECFGKSDFFNLAHDFGLNNEQLETLGYAVEQEHENGIDY